jgi:hypothetical protein
MNSTSRTRAAVLVACVGLYMAPAPAMTLKEFRKFTTEERGTYIGAAVSMLAYTYAARGNVEKARCIQSWYYGKRGAETPGPREIAIEIGVAENLDAEKYHVEGVILGVTDKACPATAAQAKPKP